MDPMVQHEVGQRTELRFVTWSSSLCGGDTVCGLEDLRLPQLVHPVLPFQAPEVSHKGPQTFCHQCPSAIKKNKNKRKK